MNKIFRLILTSLILLVVTACVHQATTQPGPIVLNAEQAVFPDGIYKQDIHVEFIEEDEKEQAEFKAILKKAPHEINMHGYMGFGIPLFKIKDNLKDPFELSANDPRIEKNKEFFRQMYPIIKELLFMKHNDLRLKAPKMTFYMKPNQFPVDAIILEWAENGSPVKFRFENKSRFKFEITTTDFSKL